MGTSTASELPLLPLRDVVVYPHMVIPLFVGRERSILALDTAMPRRRVIFRIVEDARGYGEITGGLGFQATPHNRRAAFVAKAPLPNE